MSNDVKRPAAEDNLGLVHLCANKFRGRGIEYDDLYSAGCIGLMKAVKAFDTDRGVKFSTYAIPVILGEIKRLFRDGGSVKVSRSLKELSLKLQKFREIFLKEKFHEPTIKELAEMAQVDEADAAEAGARQGARGPAHPHPRPGLPVDRDDDVLPDRPARAVLAVVLDGVRVDPAAERHRDVRVARVHRPAEQPERAARWAVDPGV